MNNKNRQGRFTSSQMYRIVGSDRVRETYIEETNIERRMNRCLDIGAVAMSMAWGKYMETRVFKLLGTEYTLVSKATIIHPDPLYADIWSGSPDLIAFLNNDAVKIAEVKCFYPKEFAKLTDAILTNDIEYIKKNRPKEYWQAVSNAILCGVDTAEIISFMPYEKEAAEIKDDINAMEGDDLWEYKFIYDKDIEKLPFLPNDGYYKNLNIFKFIVPRSDWDYLHDCVFSAGGKLDNRFEQ